MCIFCSYGSYVSKGKEFSELYVTMTGLLMIAAQCTVSGMASVYAEYILKKQQEVTYFHVLPMSASLMFAYWVLIWLHVFLVKKKTTTKYMYYVIDILQMFYLSCFDLNCI